MVDYIEVEIDGQIVKFETRKEDVSGEVAISRLPQRIKNLFPELQSTIKGISALVAKTASELHEKPTETVLEFGINVKAEAGVMVANSSAEAQIKVSLKWIKKDEKSRKRSPKRK